MSHWRAYLEIGVRAIASELIVLPVRCQYACRHTNLALCGEIRETGVVRKEEVVETGEVLWGRWVEAGNQIGDVSSTGTVNVEE